MKLINNIITQKSHLMKKPEHHSWMLITDKEGKVNLIHSKITGKILTLIKLELADLYQTIEAILITKARS